MITRALEPGARPFAGLAVLGLIGLAVSAVLGVRVPGPFGVAQPQVWAFAGLLPVYGTGLFLFYRRPDQHAARFLLAMGSAMAVATALGAVATRVYGAAPQTGWLWAVIYAEHHFDLAGPAAMGTLFARFPDGSPQRSYEWWVVRGYWTAVIVLPPLMLVSHPFLVPAVYSDIPDGVIKSPGFVPALAGLGPATEALFGAGALMGLAGAGLLVVRYRRLSERQRLQTSWLLFAALAVGVDIFVVQYLGALGVFPHADEVIGFYGAWIPALIFIPVTIGVALIRYQLFDVGVVIRRSALYAAASMVIAVVYLGGAAALGITAGDRLSVAAAVGVTIAAVVGFQPARRRLMSRADRWAFGERVGNFELLSGLGRVLEHAHDPARLAPEIATSLARGLGLRWARISLSPPGWDGRVQPIGAAGIGLSEPGQAALVVPITDGGATIGQIECGPAAKRDLGRDDEELVRTLARQVALAVRNAHLSTALSSQLAEIRRQAAELEASRTRLVAAQDAERRRIERNIHDGVQQQIVALVAKLRLARNQLSRNRDGVEQTLSEAQLEATCTLEDLRELARGIHPPLLSDRGILEAIESRISRLELAIRVQAPPEMRGTRYAADVEGAAYFLVCEALTNTLKYAQASEATVRLADDGETLAVQVIDDGVGFVPCGTAGTGLTGLSDRILAVGGRLSVISQPGAGTTVAAELPARGRGVSHA